MKSHARIIRITPKKANLIAGMVRGKTVSEALEILKYAPKKAAQILFKLLTSAVSNATNNFKQEKDNLIIKHIIVNKGPTLKRSIPISRGRMYPINKRTANISVMLGIKEQSAKKSEKAASDAATEKPATKAKAVKKSK